MDNQPLDTKALPEEIGSVFTTPRLTSRLTQKLALDRAQYYANHQWDRSNRYEWASLKLPAAA